MKELIGGFEGPYYATLDEIYHAPWTARKLARFQILREAITDTWGERPPTKLIQVTGTSGKGSTCRFLEAALGTVGAAGAMLSPHVLDYTERFSLNGQPTSHADITQVWEQFIRPITVSNYLNSPNATLTYHEVNILMALALFEKNGIEWAAMEVGMGGRYDQTTALDVEATVLTTIGEDHVKSLGEMPWQRALDKAGVARRGIPFFTSEQDSFLIEVISSVCDHLKSPLTLVGEREFSEMKHLINKQTDVIPKNSLLKGDHQVRNAALALAVVRKLIPDVDSTKVVRALVHTQFIGRLWKVQDHIYADVAHNPQKVESLVKQLSTMAGARNIIFVVGVAGARPALELLEPLSKIGKSIIFTGSHFKSRPNEEIEESAKQMKIDVPTLVIPEPEDALKRALLMREQGEAIVLTGSGYMIDQALNPDPHIKHLNRSYGWRFPREIEVKGTIELSEPYGKGTITLNMPPTEPNKF